MTDEKRAHPRLPVFGGNAEITAVMGRGRTPGERARIVNWSRGGLLLKVRSPRRRMLFLRQEPCLHESDALFCTLRLPPLYSDITLQAEVVRVERAGDDPDQLQVGLKIDGGSAQAMEALARILEPHERSSGRSGRTPRASGRSGRVSGRQPGAAPRVSGRLSGQASPRPSRKLQRPTDS